MRYCLVSLLCFLLYSCWSSDDKQLKYALDFAGENRGELEKVLDHYAGDPEKLEAARFLIRNMPRYYGYEGWRLDSLQKVLGSAERERFLPDSVMDKWKKVSLYLLPKVFDAHVITADYLIENIELSFQVWKECPWNRELPFDDFCELILPYRIGDEPLSDWRIHYFNRYFPGLDSLADCTDPLVACNNVAKELSRKEFFYLNDLDMPHLSAGFLLDYRVGACRDMCDVAIYAMRACGIPVATDMFVYSPEYQGNHQWSVVRGVAGRFYPFWITWYEIGNNMKDDGRKKGKVYRECFGVQEEPVPGITKDENVPALFKNRFVKDVTDNYTSKNEVTIDVEVEEPYIYLSVFSPNGWVPVDVAENKGGTATFHNVEPDLIYQPVYRDGTTNRAAGFPFLYLKEGGVRAFKPDPQRRETTLLTRKMSMVKGIKSFLYRNIIGVELDGSSELSFKNTEKLLELKDTLTSNYNEFEICNLPKVRYIRYSSPPGHPIELAEIAFFEDSAMEKEIPANLINPLAPLHLANSVEQINDKNILSFFESRDSTCCLLFDLGKAVDVRKIVLCPRNDDNYVWPGDQYELFYNDGVKGWLSLGKQVATGRSLSFDVPGNALFWLRNLTKGKEEQVFFCQDGSPRFVTDLP